MPKKKFKAKKIVKSVMGMFSMSGKKGKRMKSLFTVKGGGGLYPRYKSGKKKIKKVGLW